MITVEYNEIFGPTSANGIEFRPIIKSRSKPSEYGMYFADRGITGQTGLNRYPNALRVPLSTIQALRPDGNKRILSAGGSIAAEITTISARLKANGISDKCLLEMFDINARYTDHARTFRFPRGMLYKQPKWLCRAFEETDDFEWVKPREGIQKPIKIHDPIAAEDFKADQKFDVIFLMTVLQHLKKDQQDALLTNLLTQCNGIFCISEELLAKIPVGSGITVTLPETQKEARSRISKIFHQHGYIFADPSQRWALKPSGRSMRKVKYMDNAYIAIHPDLAAKMT